MYKKNEYFTIYVRLIEARKCLIPGKSEQYNIYKQKGKKCIFLRSKCIFPIRGYITYKLSYFFLCMFRCFFSNILAYLYPIKNC
jgi:hypothetical protein